MDIWQWFQNYEEWAFREGSAEHRRLPYHFYHGSRYLRNQQTTQAFSEFSDGLKLAIALKSPCWELFFRFWQMETRTYYESNIASGLDLGIRATTQAHQGAYQDCPGHAQIFFAMAEIYSFMDVIGYHPQIEEVIEHIISHTTPDDDTRYRILYLRACIAYEFDELDEAEALIAQYMDKVQGHPFRETFYHTVMRRICFARGDIPTAFNFAQEAVRCAYLSRIVPVEGWNRIWAAALAQRAENEIISGKLYYAALEHYSVHQLTKSIEFYEAACEYHEQRGAPEQALLLREEQIRAMQEIGSIQYQAQAALQRARLLGRMKEDPAPALEDARKIARNLKQPAPFLAKVEQVTEGNFSQFRWQS